MRNLLIVALLSTACYGASTSDIAGTAFADSLGVDLADSTLLPNGEYIRDVVVGTGAPIQQGQTLMIFYLISLSDGTNVGSNSGGDAAAFVLGGDNIQGLNQGFGGMNVGGTRQFVIPPALAFGDQGHPPVPPDAILVYDLQVIAAQ